jgi:hypothetical protein
MRNSCLSVMQCEKMSIADMFCRCFLTEFLVEEGNSAGIIYERLRGVYGDACMGASSVRRWVKHFKDGNTDIVDQPRCCRPRTAATGPIFEKRGNNQCSSLSSDAQQTSSYSS